MKKFLGLLIAAVLVVPSFALFTAQEVTSYKLPARVTPQIDGLIDSVWKGISNNGSIRMDFNDLTKTIFQNGNVPAEYQIDLNAHITVMSAYDDLNLYFLFIVQEEQVSKLSCGDGNLWRMDAMEVWLDPSQWDEIAYKGYFGKDADPGNALGSGRYTIQAMVPIHPEEKRFQYNAFNTTAGEFGLANAPNGTLIGAGFKDGSSNNIVAVEMRFPWSAAVPNAMYIAWGYNEWRNTFLSFNCADNFPVQHRWQAQQNATGGWLTMDPASSEDSWGKLVLSPIVAVPAATGSAEVAGTYTAPALPRCSASPDDPACTEITGAREAALPAASKFRVVRSGSSLILTGASGATTIHTMDGRQLLRSSQTVIDVSSLKAGVYLVQNGSSRKAFVK